MDKTLIVAENNAEQANDNYAKLMFSQTAWIKMNALVKHFKTEVQWNGLVKRIEPRSFLVEDILVFPQEVTGTSVDTDDIGYLEWLYDHDDETREKVRLHGHSHVDFSPAPSSRDNRLQQNILNNFGNAGTDTQFYIFFILNKQGDFHCRIYDNNHNVFYRPSEIIITVPLDNGVSLDAFVEEAKILAAEPKTEKGEKPE